MPLVLLLSFLGSSRTVYAAYIADIPYTEISNSTHGTYSWNYTLGPEEVLTYGDIAGTTNTAPVIYKCYRDLTINIVDFITGIQANPRIAINAEFFLNDDIDFTAYWTGNPPFSEANVTWIYLLNSENSLDMDYFMIPTINITAGTQGALNCHFETGTYFYLLNDDRSVSPYLVFNRSYTFRILYNRTAYSTNTSPSANNISFSLGTTTGEYGDYRARLYETYNDIQLLYNIWLQESASNTNIIAHIDAAAAQAHSDATTSQSQAADIIDDINYDHSGTSQSVSATQSAYDAAQGAADAAVDAAVHSYTSDLSTVEAYDYSSFFTSQRNSAVFWRNIGEYILDSSNLGFVSGSIIIVTLIGLVIFMLRL